MQNFRFHCAGREPLLMHNARLSDPLDEFSKAIKPISAKMKKTDEDHQRMAQLEFLGGLYYDDQLGPYLPGQNFERCLVDAAKITKAGKKIERGVFITSNVNPVEYTGPRKPEELYEDRNFVSRASSKVQQNRVMRTRPCFRQWEVYADGIFDPALINLAELQQIAQTAGMMIGLGDWRPRYGRFTGTITELGASDVA